MNKRALIVALFLSAMASHLWAQADSLPAGVKPSPPYLARLPNNAAWTITFTAKAPAASAKNGNTNSFTVQGEDLTDTMARMEITKAGKFKREEITWSNGRQSEDWLVGKIFFHQDPNSGGYGYSTGNLNDKSDGEDFPEFGWIDLNHFFRAEQKNGEPCFLYQCTSTRKQFANKPSTFVPPVHPTLVWVSVRTKLPVALEDNVKMATYEFTQPKEMSLKLPSPCQKYLDIIVNYEKKRQSQQMVVPP